MKTTEQLNKDAQEIGGNDFKSGKGQVPAQSKTFMNFLESLRKETGENKGLCVSLLKAYTRGWHRECDKSLAYLFG